jgi:hypothetical protein
VTVEVTSIILAFVRCAQSCQDDYTAKQCRQEWDLLCEGCDMFLVNFNYSTYNTSNRITFMSLHTTIYCSCTWDCNFLRWFFELVKHWPDRHSIYSQAYMLFTQDRIYGTTLEHLRRLTPLTNTCNELYIYESYVSSF